MMIIIFIAMYKISQIKKQKKTRRNIFLGIKEAEMSQFFELNKILLFIISMYKKSKCK